MKAILHFKSGSKFSFTIPNDQTVAEFVRKQFNIDTRINGAFSSTPTSWSIFSDLAVNWNEVEFVQGVIE